MTLELVFRAALILTLLVQSIFTHGQYWMQKGGSLNVDEAYDVAVDGSGNAYATGYFTGTATFGSTTLTSSGSSDIFIVKISNTGAYQWAVKAGGSGNDRGLSIAIDALGNSYVTGYFNSSATFGTSTLTSNGQQDVFVAKYNSAGVIQWAVSAGGSDADIGNGIAIDNSGNPIVAGEFKGTSTFGSSTLSSANSSTDAFVSKLNTSGVFQWTKHGEGNFNDRAVDVGCDGAGNVYVAGQFSDTFSFDVTHNNTMLNAAYVVKFNSAGAEQWFKMIGGGNSNQVNGIAVNTGGNVHITGDFTGTITFFNTANTNLSTAYDNGVFVAKYTSAGATSWASSSGSDNLLTSNDIAIDASGNAYIIGHFECDFTEYTEEYGEAIFNTVGYKDIYTSKFNSSGVWQWGRQIGSRSEDYGYGISTTGSGQVHVAASFKSNLVVPTSPNFQAANLANWIESECGSNSPYCGDSHYGSFYRIPTTGNSDALIANCFDPARKQLDYYLRTGGGCNLDHVPGCINSGCPDTLSGCNNVLGIGIPKTCIENGPDFKFNWSNGAFGNNLTSNTTNFNTEGVHWVKFTTTDNCFSYYDSIYVEILPPPDKPFISDDVIVNNPTPNPEPIHVCIPEIVTLTGSNFEVDSFMWQGPGLPASGQNDSIIQVSQTGTYIFTVIDSNGCQRSNSVYVEFYEPLDSFILKVLLEDTIYQCDNAPFAVMLYDSISNPTAIEDCFNMMQPNFSTSFTYTPSTWVTSTACQTILYVVPEDTGWFHFDAMVIRSIPCDTDTFYLSDSVYVIPMPAPSVESFTINMVGSSYFCPGQTCMQYGTGGQNYLWSGPGVNGSTEDTVHIGIEAVYYLYSTMYDTNQYGCMDSLTAVTAKNIYEKPQPQINAEDLLICPNDTVWISVTNTGATSGFFWEGPNGPIPGDTNVIPATDAGTYYCVVNDSDSCDLTSNSIVLLQYTTPALMAGGDLVICEGDSLVLNVVSNSGSEIEWLPPLSGNGTSQTVFEPGVYTCKITSCDITTYATIEVFPSVVEAEITPGGVLCLDSFAVLYGSPGMSDYQWSSTNQNTDSIIITQPGTYTLTTTDSNGCSKVSDPVTITITQEPTAISLLGYPVFCYDTSITLFGNSSMANYLWLPSGDTTQNFTTNEAGTYVLKTIDTNGCRGTSEPQKVTIPDTVARLAIEGDLQFCEGDSVSFRANRGGMAEYLWLPDSLYGREVYFYNTGTYSLLTTDTFGCLAWSENVSVYMQPNEIEKPTGDDTLICALTFADLYAQTNIGTLKWSERPYGNVINEGTHYQTPELNMPMRYYVWAEHDLCRGDTAEIKVDAMDCHGVFYPNIFSPNGDNVNDYFTITLNEIKCFYLVIYNRWGVKLFETTDVTRGWDGTVQETGKPVEEGTYYFIAHYCRFDGTEGDIKSYITLIRQQ